MATVSLCLMWFMNKNRLVGSLIVHLGAANRVPVYNGGVGGGRKSSSRWQQMFSPWLDDADEPALPASDISLAWWHCCMPVLWNLKGQMSILARIKHVYPVRQQLWIACQPSACSPAWIIITCFGFVGRQSLNPLTNSIALLLFIAFGPGGRLL